MTGKIHPQPLSGIGRTGTAATISIADPLIFVLNQWFKPWHALVHAHWYFARAHTHTHMQKTAKTPVYLVAV